MVTHSATENEGGNADHERGQGKGEPLQLLPFGATRAPQSPGQADDCHESRYGEPDPGQRGQEVDDFVNPAPAELKGGEIVRPEEMKRDSAEKALGLKSYLWDEIPQHDDGSQHAVHEDHACPPA